MALASIVNVSHSICLQKEVAKEVVGRVYSLDMSLSNGGAMIFSIVMTTALGDGLLNTALILTFVGFVIAITLYGSSKMAAIDQEA